MKSACFQARQNEMNYIYGRVYLLNIYGANKLREIIGFESRYRNYYLLISNLTVQKLENKQSENLLPVMKL